MVAIQGAAVSAILAATIVVGAFAAASLLHDARCASRAWKRIRGGWLHERLKSHTDRYAVRMYGPVDLRAASGVCRDGKCAAVLRIPALAQDAGVDGVVRYVVAAGYVGGRVQSVPDKTSVNLESWRSGALVPWEKLDHLYPAPAMLHVPCGWVLGLPP